MMPYSMKHVSIMHKVASDFCSLNRMYKIYIGNEFDVLNIEDVDLSDENLEIKIWDAVLKAGRFTEFMLAVAHHTDLDRFQT